MRTITLFHNSATMTTNWWAAASIKPSKSGTWCRLLTHQQIQEKNPISITQGLSLIIKLPLSRLISKELTRVWTTQITKCSQALTCRAQSALDPSSMILVRKLVSRSLLKSPWVFRPSIVKVNSQTLDLFSMLIDANSTKTFKIRIKSLTYTF